MATISDKSIHNRVYTPATHDITTVNQVPVVVDIGKFTMFDILMASNIVNFEFIGLPQTGTRESVEVTIILRQDNSGYRSIGWVDPNVTSFYLERSPGSYGSFPSEFPTRAPNSIDIIKIRFIRQTNGTFGYISLFALNSAVYGAQY